MKPIFKIAALLLVVLVAPGCEAKGLIGHAQDAQLPQRQVAVETQYKLNGTPIPAALPNSVLPADGQLYQANLLEVQQAWNTRVPGRFIGLPSGVSDSGYPMWPARCVFTTEGARCSLIDGANNQQITELVLARRVSIMRNVDVAMNPYVTCGFTLCTNQEGLVIGYISKEMQSWMSRNCNWDEESIATCPYME